MASPDRAGLNRRAVLQIIGGGCALAAAGGCTIAEVFGVSAGGELEFDLADDAFAALRPVGGALAVDGGGRPIVLIRVTEARVVALNRICTHQACDMTPGALGRWDGDRLICICHNSAFDAEGAVLQGPATRPLATYDVVFDAATGTGRVRFGAAEPGSDAAPEPDAAPPTDTGPPTDGEPDGDPVPAEYRDLVNPFAGDAEARQAGATLYAAECAGCHGAEGRGGVALNPEPSAFNVDQSGWTDGYFFWRIKTGPEGGPVGSLMPPYGDRLTDDQIWQLITYLRSLAP